MIRPIDIRLNAAHPELPLAEAVTFTGAPSTVLIRGVPPNCGRWAITAVSVAATFPDGSTTTRAAVQSANGVWVATLPATARSGRTENGLRVMADGIDENGAAVTGYILGVADFAVASLGVTPAPEPGETSWQMLYFDATPATPRKGDVIRNDGDLKFYNGTAWLPFTDLSNYYTAEQVDEAIDKLAAYYITYNAAGANFPTRAALLNAQTYYSGGVERTPTRNDYAVVLADETHDGAEWRYIYAVAEGQTAGQWEPQYPIETNDYTALSNKPQINGNTLTGNKTAADLGLATKADATLTERGDPSTPGFSAWEITWVNPYYPDPIDGVTWHDGDWFLTVNGQAEVDTGISDRNAVSIDVPAAKAIRTALPGYCLGPDAQTNPNRDKPLASEAEAEALRMGKANRAANPTAGNLAALDASGNPTDSTIPAANVALKSAIPYDLGTPIVIDSASSDPEGEMIYFGAATLADRTANIVQVLAPLDELRITFPAATSGKVRDFGLRVEIGTGSAALAAPALVPVAPSGETIKIENNAAKIPALADGTATAKGVTLLYFSENAPGVFVVKGEQVEEVA